MPYYINLQSTNPLTRLLAALVGVLVIVGAVFFGLIVLGFVMGAGLLIWMGMWIRLRWLRYRHGSADWSTIVGSVQGAPQDKTQQTEGETIEAEYTVISSRDD
jgi:hypothetical protein